MSTITKEFTKEQIIAKAREQIAFCRHTKITGECRTHVNQCLELFEIALASLEAEPVAWIVHARTGDQLTTDGGYVANAEGILGLHSTPLYTAPPAPVSVPAAYIRDERGRMMLNGKPEPRIGYGDGWNACRAAMLQGAVQPQNQQQNILENIPATQFKPVSIATSRRCLSREW